MASSCKQPPGYQGAALHRHEAAALLAPLQRDYKPQDKVGKQAWQPTGKEQNEEQQPEPERAEAKELPQSATDTAYPAIVTRTSQIAHFEPPLISYTFAELYEPQTHKLRDEMVAPQSIPERAAQTNHRGGCRNWRASLLRELACITRS